MSVNWKPSWISIHEPNVGLVIDDHCFLVLIEQEDGSWKPTTWIPRAGVGLIRRYSSQLDEECQMTHFVGDDCPGGHGSTGQEDPNNGSEMAEKFRQFVKEQRERAIHEADDDCMEKLLEEYAADLEDQVTVLEDDLEQSKDKTVQQFMKLLKWAKDYSSLYDQYIDECRRRLAAEKELRDRAGYDEDLFTICSCHALVPCICGSGTIPAPVKKNNEH